MSLITWNDYFVTGIDIIDEQHRWLIGLINKAAPILVQPYALTNQAADELLDQLTAYAVFHFQTEEELMAEYGIDPRHSEHHRASHADFAAHVREMRDHYERTGDISGGELLTFLANWLVFHILSDDQTLGRQLTAIRNGKKPSEAFENAEGRGSDPAQQAKTHALIDLYQLINLQYSNLQSVYQELDGYRNHLEQKVAQRTSQLAQARDQAEAASRAKSAFLANMSHEFRTPMNAIAGMTWSLLQQIQEPALREKLQIVAHASERLQEMLGEILDMVKLESGELTLEPVDFSLHAMLRHAVAAISADAEAKHLNFVSELAPELADMLHGDGRRISKMLGQLLSNAVKFTDEGEIRLRAEIRRTDDIPLLLVLSVSDTGKGIAKHDIERLFHPFEQLDASRTRAQGGAGLGLALCRRIARLMGGDITVTSEPERGSQFVLTIPVHPALAIHAPVEVDNATACAAQRVRTAGKGSLAEALECVQCLRPLIAEDDIQALHRWNECAEVLNATLGHEAAEIRRELEAYNFEQALVLLDGALASLQSKADKESSTG